MSLERIATFLFFFSRVVVPPTKMYCKKYASNPKTAFKIRTNIIVPDYAPTSLNTPPRARRDVAKERATRPSLFWGVVVFDLSRCLPFAGGLFTLPALQRRRLLPKKRFLPQQKKE